VLGDTSVCLSIYCTRFSNTVFELRKQILEVVIWNETRRTIMGCGIRRFVFPNKVFGPEVGRSDAMLRAWIS
jgi:hypothetical protein